MIAKLSQLLGAFYLKHWQWILSTIIAIISLYAAVLAIK